MKLGKTPCCKCKTEQATVLIRHAYYCQKCFLYTFVGKYRSILNKSKSMARTCDKVLLACSGGPSSAALIRLTSEFMHVEPHEKKKIQLIKSALICHIDESALFEQQSSTAAQVKEMVIEQYSHMPLVIQAMEDIFDPQFTSQQDFQQTLTAVAGSSVHDYDYPVQITQDTCGLSNREKLKALFDGVTKYSAKEDLYAHIKMAMLVTIARRENCSFIFFADSSTRQSIKMISATSKGRGYSIPLDVGVENAQSFPGIVVLRPMKDMLAKEIGLYNRFTGIDKYVVPPTSFGTQMPAKTSIERLTEEFLVTLERDFPSTVSTISRTVSKLTPSSDMDTKRACAVCLMPYPPGIEDWRRRITVTNVNGEKEDQTTTTTCSNTNDGCCGSGTCSAPTSTIDFNEYLCYSCQVNLKDYKSDAVGLLPPYVVQKISDNERQERLRNQIKDFLIDDDE